jgi:hypothetical protein
MFSGRIIFWAEIASDLRRGRRNRRESPRLARGNLADRKNTGMGPDHSAEVPHFSSNRSDLGASIILENPSVRVRSEFLGRLGVIDDVLYGNKQILVLIPGVNPIVVAEPFSDEGYKNDV